jgi:hypothetical protein
MEIKDLEALIQITKVIEAQGYFLRDVDSKIQHIGYPSIDITLKITRERVVAKGTPLY